MAGIGLMLGSLAKIIALRMTHRRSAWLLFHWYSVPFLLITGGLAYLWLFAR